MEKKLICLDTSVLIDYFRQKDKTKSFSMLWQASMILLRFLLLPNMKST